MEAPGATHHAVPQGSSRRRIVEDDRDRVAYLNRFTRIALELSWNVVSGCLMDTHHHAIVRTAEPNLALGMKRLQGGHARWLNVRYGGEGHVFRQRFWSRRITNDGWLFRACVYAVVNPVAAGLCSHPREWRWCSYASIAGGDPEAFAPGEELLLSMFGETPRAARQGYVDVVDDGVERIMSLRLRDSRAVSRAIREVAPIAREEQVSG